MATIKYEDITLEYIEKWCVENNQIDWLIEISGTKTIQKRHTGRIQKRDVNGNAVLNKNGKPVWIVDKNSPTIEVEIAITFIEIKKAFCEKFMPELAPKAKENKLSLHERLKQKYGK